MADSGIAFRSAGAEPRPTAPPRLTKAEVWRRLPFTSTSTWSGDNPRNCAGRVSSAPSTRLGRGKLIDGISLASTVASSLEPELRRLSPVITSMGDSEALAVRSWARVPVTITVSSRADVSLSSVACAAPAPPLQSTAPSTLAETIAVDRRCFV